MQLTVLHSEQSCSLWTGKSISTNWGYLLLLWGNYSIVEHCVVSFEWHLQLILEVLHCSIYYCCWYNSAFLSWFQIHSVGHCNETQIGVYYEGPEPLILVYSTRLLMLYYPVRIYRLVRFLSDYMFPWIRRLLLWWHISHIRGDHQGVMWTPVAFDRIVNID